MSLSLAPEQIEALKRWLYGSWEPSIAWEKFLDGNEKHIMVAHITTFRTNEYCFQTHYTRHVKYFIYIYLLTYNLGLTAGLEDCVPERSTIP